MKRTPEGARLQFGLSWRLALRHFSKSPGSYLYGAVTLALGLGSATLVFSAVQGLTQPLPVPDGEDVLRVVVADPIRQHHHFTVDDLRAWRDHARSSESIAAVAVAERLVGIGRGDFYARVAHATTQTFPLLGVQPLFGRWPAEGDGTEIAIGEDLWAISFESDRAVLGKAVRLDDEIATVVGVMPSAFRFPYKQQIWQVVASDSSRLANGEVVTRLAPGVSRAAASDEFTELMRASRTDAQGVPTTATARLVGFTEERADGTDYAILTAMLLVVIGLVLLSCSNVTALMLERNIVRARTLGLHQALGARPAQVGLQILVEALLVGGLGAILGYAVANAGLRFLANSLSDNLSFYWTQLELDLASVVFAGVLGLVVALVCGAVPAWRASKTDVASTLAEQGDAVRSVQRTPLSWILINAQVALAVAVVVAAVGMTTILVDKPWLIELVDEYAGDRAVAAMIVFEGDPTEDGLTRVGVIERLLDRVRELPGVDEAAASAGDWLGGYSARAFAWRRVALDDEPFGDGGDGGDGKGTPILHVTPGFLDTFGLRIIDGRDFDAGDMRSMPSTGGVAIVTERFVRDRLAGQAAVGRQIRLDVGGGAEQAFRLVGVVSNLAVTKGQREHPRAHVLLPITSDAPRTFQLTARTEGSRGTPGIGAQLMQIARDTDPGVAAAAFSFAEYVHRTNDYLGRIPETFGLLAILGGSGCVLVVAIGIYGLVGFEMRQRLGEYAVRVALGARTDRLLRLVVRRVCLLTVPGALVGFVFAWAGSPLLRLFGSTEIAVLPVFLAVVALYAVVVVIAAGVPALRVLRGNPARVLNG